MITYDPKTASGFQKLSSSAIEIGNIPLITGPIFGIILRTIAINALETTYFTSNIDKTINDNKPTDKELRILFDHFTFSSLYFAIGKHPLAIFILFSYPYLYKKIIK